jgi:homoserine O-acetyltransferase
MASEYYGQDLHGPYELFELGDFEFESGAKVRNLTLAFATFGALAPDKSNAILFPTWYSGSSKILEQAYIGPGRALDPSKYFIILVNQIGNGLSSSPSNAPAPFNAAAFPQPSIGDDVRAQYELVTRHFGLTRLALVLGGSMGAQQSWEWAVRYPEFVARVAPIAGTAKETPHNRLLVETFIDAIAADPTFDGGWYAPGAVHRGLRAHAKVFAASGFTPALYNTRGWGGFGFTTTEDFVTGFVANHFLPQDPNNLLLLARKWRDGDVSRHAGGDLKAALGRIKAKTAVIAIDEDAFFPLADLAAEQALIPNSQLKRISSVWGHLALFGVDPGFNAAIDAILGELLATPA